MAKQLRKYKEPYKVELIANEFRWVCPICDESNWETEIKNWVTCNKCCETFEVNNGKAVK